MNDKNPFKEHLMFPKEVRDKNSFKVIKTSVLWTIIIIITLTILDKMGIID